MTHLIPTPQTDKNGITSIRHMRPPVQSSLGSKPIPPVSIKSNAPSSTDMGKLATDVLAAQPNFHVPIPPLDEFAPGIDRLAESSPEVYALIQRTLTTGSERARIACAMHLMNSIKMLRGFSGGVPSHIDPIDVKLNEIWHGETVAEESGHAGEIDFSRRSSIIYMDPRQTRQFNDETWRGYAMFRLAFETPEGSRASGASGRFMNWAGRQDPEKLGLIIEFAQARKTMDPNILQPLIYSPASDTALREGLL
jgi:hypothetical protein